MHVYPGSCGCQSCSAGTAAHCQCCCTLGRSSNTENNCGQVCIVFHRTCFCPQAAANTNTRHQLVGHRVTALTVNQALLFPLPSLQTQPCFRSVEALPTEQVAAGFSSAHTAFSNLYPPATSNTYQESSSGGEGQTESVDRLGVLPQAMTARAHFPSVPAVPSTIPSTEQFGSKNFNILKNPCSSRVGMAVSNALKGKPELAVKTNLYFFTL